VVEVSASDGGEMGEPNVRSRPLRVPPLKPEVLGDGMGAVDVDEGGTRRGALWKYLRESKYVFQTWRSCKLGWTHQLPDCLCSSAACVNGSMCPVVSLYQ
jgi:hypothetical protein